MKVMPATDIEPIFASFLMGGFEGACFSFCDDRRVDCIAATSHDRLCEVDYALLRSIGLSTVRDSFRWSLIERSAGNYDWSSIEPMVRAAAANKMQVIWDLCHFGLPDWVDITAPGFAAQFAGFARAAADFVATITPEPQWWCPINEISYWSFAAGDLAYMQPCLPGQASLVKHRLVAGFLAARAAIQASDPRARFISTDPLIWVSDEEGRGCPTSTNASFEALDMLLGCAQPDLGGTPASVDVIGVNYYSNNQWRDGTRASIGMGQFGYRPLRDILLDVWNKYHQPILVSETGAEEPNGASWLTYVRNEVHSAQQAGANIVGICLYPVMDYPGWLNNRHCACGILELDAGLTVRRLRWAPLSGCAHGSEANQAWFDPG